MVIRVAQYGTLKGGMAKSSSEDLDKLVLREIRRYVQFLFENYSTKIGEVDRSPNNLIDWRNFIAFHAG